MVMEYIHFIMPRIADKETVNHICGEVNNWMRLHSYKPKPIKRTADQRHFKHSAPAFRVEYLRAFHVQEILHGDNRARFISTLFPREFADTDIATIKNFKVEPLKTLIPIDEPENGRLDFHYPADYVRKSITSLSITNNRKYSTTDNYLFYTASRITLPVIHG